MSHYAREDPLRESYGRDEDVRYYWFLMKVTSSSFISFLELF